METKRLYDKALEISKFVGSKEDVKLDILAKYGLMADAIYGGAGVDLVRVNIDTFRPLMSSNVIKWVMTEKGKPVFTKAVQVSPKLATMFKSEEIANNTVKRLARELGVEISDYSGYDDVALGISLFGVESIDDVDVDELAGDYIDAEDESDNIGIEFDDVKISEATVINTDNATDVEEEVEGYNERIHGGYRRQIESLFLNAWESLYGYHVEGKEIVDGFIVPGGSILATGESMRYEGVLTLATNKVVVKPNTMSNAIYEEFISSCKACGVDMIKEVAEDANDVKPFKYNPMLQRRIASGAIDKKAFKDGWAAYAKALTPYIRKKTKELALIRAETGSDEETYKALSGYTISLMVVNYKDELGTQLRICCGDTSKTQQVADTMVSRLRARERTHKSIAQGKLVVGNAILSDSGLTATITVYQNMAGYQAVPQFMGELLCNLSEGRFKPSLKNMIIGVDMKNNIVTAPFTKWLLPIIAGSRSGKGVLTLNMLLNVIGSGTPLFYLDGKPDMAALLWKLQEKYNIPNSVVIDGIGYKGVTDVDRKPYRAPYADNLEKMMQSPTADEVLENNFGVMIYLKTMLVILLSCEYYKTHMESKYGDLFVVFDEMFKVMKTQVEVFVMNIDNAIAKLDKSDKDRKNELLKIKMWITELLQSYIGNDIGVFGAGIKAVALTQFAQDGQYNVSGFTVAKTFCTNFLLKRSVKLFGRQEGGSGTYGVQRDKDDDINFDLYNKYFHFGIGTEQGNTYNNLKTFKPLLVLNENDCMEMTGADKDGAFTGDMLGRVAMYSDIDQFRQKYFTDEALSKSIGFEGALEQVGRLIGADWTDMLNKSLSRSFEIADEALRYYGIVGTDGIDSLYDYICSLETSHLWTFNDIIKAKNKGESLNGGSAGVEGDSMESDSMFSGVPDDAGIDDEDISEDTTGSLGVNDEVVGETAFGGVSIPLSAEELDILNSEKIVEGLEEEDNNIDNYEEVGYDTYEYEGNYEEYTGDEVGIDSDNSYDENTEDDIGIEDENEYNESVKEERIPDIDPRPEELGGTGGMVFNTGGKTGKKLFVSPTPTTKTLKFTEENSIIAKLGDSHPLESSERRLFRNIKGAEYEFSRRWEAILNAVCKRINKDLVTRVMIVQNEMYVNGRLVSMVNIVGGFANIRLEDLVDFKELFTRFRNIRELTLDTTMLERFEIEQPNLPEGFFAYSDKLIKVSIIYENGTKEVIDRRDLTFAEKAERAVNQARFRNQFDAVCASKNPKFKDESPGYKNKVWNTTKTLGGNGWNAMKNQINKENPSYLKATGIGVFTLGALAVGSAIYGISSLFGLFKRK